MKEDKKDYISVFENLVIFEIKVFFSLLYLFGKVIAAFKQ